MFFAKGVASHHDHSRSADQHDSRFLGEGAAKGGAFIARGDAAILGEIDHLAEQGCGTGLQTCAGFHATGANRCSGERLVVVIGPCGLQAGADGLPEAFLAARGIQVADTGARAFSQNMPALLSPATEPAAAMGLTSIESGQDWGGVRGDLSHVL